MKKIRQIRRLRKGWKILGAAILAVIVFSGYMLYVNASTNVNLSLNTSGLTISSKMVSNGLSANLSGTDDNSRLPTLAPMPEWIEWTTSNPAVVRFDNGGVNSDATGANPTLYADHAGRATISAAYYSKKYDPDTGAEISRQQIGDARTAMVIVPLDIKVTDSVDGAAAAPSSTVYPVGATITFETNTASGNPIFVSTDNDKTGNLTADGVLRIKDKTENKVVLEVIGGGRTNLVVRTADGDGNEDLMKRYQIKAEVHVDTTKMDDDGTPVIKTRQNPDFPIWYGTVGVEKYMILDDTDFVPFSNETIPSNVLYPETSNVSYGSAKPDVCTVEYGRINAQKKISAGVSLVTMGIKADDTAWYTVDYVNIVVPFKKMGNNVSNMNVGDQIQLSTSAAPSTVTWTSDDTEILTVDDKGLVTAKKAGTTKIRASRNTDDNEYEKYNQPITLVYELTVIDGFALSTTSTSVNVDEKIVLKALVTESDLEKNPVTYKIVNQAYDSGVIPTEDLISVEQKGAEFEITGLVAGTVHMIVSQNVNGVIKSETCVIYVTTPVKEISIEPSSITVNRGETGTVQLHFNPPGPTNPNVLWGTSNPSVATVEGDSYTATITGVKGGTSTITVISEDGLKRASCDVYIREPVTGLSLNATTVESSMAVGQYQLVPTILPAGDGVNRNVTWTSSNPSVCTVDENGLVTYVKPGYCTIICQTEEGSFIATCNFVINIPVEEIKLDYTDEIMRIGDTLRITAEVFPITASDKTLVWESSNPNVCMVDSNGLVEAVGTGSCTILCKSLDGGYTAMCNIYVKQPVTSVVLNTTDITVRKGQVFWLNATCLPENADNKIVTWESRDEDVCTVENDGKVTATGAGTTSIIATNVDTGLTAYCVVTVTQPVTGLTLNSDYQLLWVGAKYAIIPKVEPIDAENKNVTYMSSDTSVATVDENGIVTALKGGSCVIEVKTEECGLIAACTIEVKEYVSSITLSEHFKFMNYGASGTLTAAVGTETATNKEVVWTSSNYDICSVDGKGNLLAGVPGTAVITATAADGSGVSDSCVVRVVNPVTAITIEPSTVRLLVGESQIVTANVYPEDASVKDVTWTSSNESVATVDEAGEIFALSTGKCKITATSTDGNDVKGICWVYVTPVINISSLKINSSEIYMLNGKSRKLNVRIRPAVNTDSYEWYSSDTGVVVVDQDGVITTVGPGTAEVFVESNAAGVSSTCIVHSLGISRSSITLEQYDKYWLDVLGTTDKVTWRSSNPRVCTVDSSGEVVARKAGTATVTAVVHDKTLSCVVRVTNFK